MYRSRISKFIIRFSGIIKCNHPAEFIEPFTWNDRISHNSYGEKYPGYMCGLCYSKVDLPLLSRIDSRL